MRKFVKTILALGMTSALGLPAANAATYQVIDKGNVSSLKYTYSQQENNNGEAAISGTGIYNFPVQFQYFDEDDYDTIVALANRDHEAVHDLNDIEDEAALRAGTPTANDLSWVLRFLQARAGNSLYQQFGDIFAMTNFNGQTELFNVFDTNLPGTELFTRSTKEYIEGITNEGWVYGSASAPYLPLDFTESDGEQVTHWVRSFTTRGFFSPDGGNTIIEIVPPSETELPEDQRFGGESAILDISDSHYAVGYASTSIDKNGIDFITDESGGCADPERLKDVPFEVCVQGVVENIYNTEAFKWTIDEQGVVTSEALGQLVTPHPDDEREYINYAQAVNNHGVAVGFAYGWWDENETEPSVNERRELYAVVYKDGEVKDFTDDHSEYFRSKAYDINDGGIAVGHVTTYINGNLRTKFYHVDTNADTMAMVLPTDFFTGSSSTARAINEAGKIVGEGEVETHNDNASTPRRTHGFLYDISTETFTDLNNFLSCDSPYTIIEARDINDADEISATALVRVPRHDAKGELMFDEQGEQLFEDVVRAVSLKPIAGEIENCSEVEEKTERKGAGLGLSSLFLLVLVALRRRFHLA
ncbi:Protein of unknown function [Colwellia chukchiensis]|uniref:DUF3466 family protein n=1 Tax=Colwellia chukchiensis TaxID=641665 RepID=A0A1H7KII5_9GAMM|nr:DUF3466 family protein [Colwellia chukchiensis]SEK86671.1 Protein of unknown function [Colwellia chukchiensis]